MVRSDLLLYRVLCEVCGVKFPNEFELRAHLPCRANSKLEHLGLFDKFRLWRKTRRGILSTEEIGSVLKILDGSTAEEVFHLACKRAHFPYSQGYAVFRAEMWLQFLACLCDEIDGENPRPEHRREAARIEREYVRSDAEGRAQIASQLFDAKCALEKIAKRDGPGRPPDLPQKQFDLQAIRTILESCEGEKARAPLKKLDVDMPENKKDYYARLKKLRHTYDVRSKKRVN